MISPGRRTMPQAAPRTALSRRQLLLGSAAGFGGLALCSLLACRRNETASPAPRSQAARKPNGKRVIFLYMGGGPSQMDTFDPKPRLTKDDGRQYQPVDGEKSTGKLMKSPYKFAKYGESGADVSEIFPHIATCVDEMAIVRSMVTDFSEHPTANYFLHTGSPRLGHPSIGAWINYGLGSECDDLPGYLVLECGAIPEGGLHAYGNGFLPATYQPSFLSAGQQPIENLEPLEQAPRLQRSKLAVIDALNRDAAARAAGNHELEAVIANYELAFRMQTSVPDLLDISGETRATHELYGTKNPETSRFGIQCLLARKLVERGVRFVELIPPGYPGVRYWDQHSNLEKDLRTNALGVDQPIAALLKDLRARGLLDDTLVLWGGEFGRAPTEEVGIGKAGRNHSRHGFTIWLAGGGVRPGLVYGATDDYGDFAVDKPVHVHDLQATILHLLGIDHTKLTYRYGGRDFRLTDVYGEVVHDLLV